MRTFDNIVQHPFGFFQIKDMPSPEELSEYYEKKYYQESKGSYEILYRPEEIRHIRGKIDLRWKFLEHRFDGAGRLLDVGCGEGFTLAFFKSMGWEVLGLDFSKAGMEAQNPEVLSDLVVGDVFTNLAEQIAAEDQFDIIWLQNVLEHVTDPVGLMESLAKLVRPGGSLVVTVPNDFSELQLKALDEGKVTRPYWIAPPDHLSYFSSDSLRKIGAETGWVCDELVADFPVDWFLFNRNSNYIEDGNCGKAAHLARVELENLLLSKPVADLKKLYSALADLGMGRDITAFYRRP
jgi:2-polyprenyl-3-methyl-5-hydroxy-6-metoxy-1,4-benzoquinol methylase